MLLFQQLFVWFVSMMIIEILSLIFGLIAKLNCVMWAMVIAGKAGETSIVVLPFGFEPQSTLNVFYRANIRTDSTFHAFRTVYAKMFVRNEVLHKYASDES